MIEMKTVSNLSHNPLVLALVLLAGLIYLDDDKEVARRMTGMEDQIQVMGERVQELGERLQGLETRTETIVELVRENGRQIKALSEQVAENSKQIAILGERITRLHPELSAKR